MRDFNLHLDGQDSPRQHHHTRMKRGPEVPALSQSERDWAFAKRALARGTDPEEVIREIARYRRQDKNDPEYYARLTVDKAQKDLARKANPRTAATADSEEPSRKLS